MRFHITMKNAMSYPIADKCTPGEMCGICKKKKAMFLCVECDEPTCNRKTCCERFKSHRSVDTTLCISCVFLITDKLVEQNQHLPLGG
jgi:hypothetical protein